MKMCFLFFFGGSGAPPAGGIMVKYPHRAAIGGAVHTVYIDGERSCENKENKMQIKCSCLNFRVRTFLSQQQHSAPCGHSSSSSNSNSSEMLPQKPPERRLLPASVSFHHRAVAVLFSRLVEVQRLGLFRRPRSCKPADVAAR